MPEIATLVVADALVTVIVLANAAALRHAYVASGYWVNGYAQQDDSLGALVAVTDGLVTSAALTEYPL